MSNPYAAGMRELTVRIRVAAYVLRRRVGRSVELLVFDHDADLPPGTHVPAGGRGPRRAAGSGSIAGSRGGVRTDLRAGAAPPAGKNPRDNPPSRTSESASHPYEPAGPHRPRPTNSPVTTSLPL